MSSSLFCTLVAAAAGIVAGLWLCMGSAFTSTETIAELATSRWDYNKIHADVVIAQSAQYAVGAPLLVFAFVFQVLAAVVPTDVTLWVPILHSSPLRFLAFIIVSIWGAVILLVQTDTPSQGFTCTCIAREAYGRERRVTYVSSRCFMSLPTSNVWQALFV